MPRPKGSKVEKEILNLLADGRPRTMRELERELGRYWYAIYYNLKEKPDNLIRRGCVEEERIEGPTLNRAQDMYRYKKGENFEQCLG